MVDLVLRRAEISRETVAVAVVIDAVLEQAVAAKRRRRPARA